MNSLQQSTGVGAPNEIVVNSEQTNTRVEDCQ